MSGVTARIGGSRKVPDPPDPPPLPLDHAEIHAGIEARLATLEASVTRVESRVEEKQPDQGELGRLRWFMKHGRRRPW